MSDQLHKNLTGQYGFSVDSDRTATLANLGFGATGTAAGAVVTKLALPTFPATTTVAPTMTLDWSASRAVYFPLNSTGTPTLIISFSNPSDKQFDVFIAVTGTPTITWPAGIKWPGGAAPAVPATGKIGWYRFYYNTAATTFFGEGLVTLS